MVEAKLVLQEVEHLPPVVDALFRMRYGTSVPDFPHHVVAWLDAGQGRQPLCYIHFSAQGEALLGGGACVDQRLLRKLPMQLRRDIRAAGGVYHATLAWAIRHFASRYSAVFGFCGDVLAERVDRAVGFVDTGHEHLLVYWLAALDARERKRLIAAAHAVGPF